MKTKIKVEKRTIEIDGEKYDAIEYTDEKGRKSEDIDYLKNKLISDAEDTLAEKRREEYTDQGGYYAQVEQIPRSIAKKAELHPEDKQFKISECEGWSKYQRIRNTIKITEKEEDEIIFEFEY